MHKSHMVYYVVIEFEPVTTDSKNRQLANRITKLWSSLTEIPGCLTYMQNR